MSAAQPEPALPGDGDPLRAWILKVTLVVALSAGILLSWKLWLPNRLYPLTPVSEALPPVPALLGAIWLYTLLALLVGIAVLSRPGILLGAFLILAGTLALWDQSRWQPWFYQYYAMLVCVFWFPRDDSEQTTRRALLNGCRIIIAGTYFWSGIQKFNYMFATDVYPWLLEPLVPPEARGLARYGALLPPVIEAVLGLALLVPNFRTPAIVGLVAMHSGILYCLGPWGHNWNTVVWPWNLAMMAFVTTLFARTPTVRFGALLWQGRSLVRWGVLVLFGLMPAFNLVDRWDAYLSAALYSGNTLKAEILLDQAAYDHLPPEVQAFTRGHFDGRHVVELSTWSMGELNVPIYPAARIYRSVARALLAGAGKPVEAEVIFEHPPNWLTGERESTREIFWDGGPR